MGEMIAITASLARKVSVVMKERMQQARGGPQRKSHSVSNQPMNLITRGTTGVGETTASILSSVGHSGFPNRTMLSTYLPQKRQEAAIRGKHAMEAAACRQLERAGSGLSRGLIKEGYGAHLLTRVNLKRAPRVIVDSERLASILFPAMVVGTAVWIARMPEIEEITAARQVLEQIMELHEVAQAVKDVNELVDAGAAANPHIVEGGGVQAASEGCTLPVRKPGRAAIAIFIGAAVLDIVVLLTINAIQQGA